MLTCLKFPWKCCPLISMRNWALRHQELSCAIEMTPQEWDRAIAEAIKPVRFGVSIYLVSVYPGDCVSVSYLSSGVKWTEALSIINHLVCRVASGTSSSSQFFHCHISLTKLLQAYVYRTFLVDFRRRTCSLFLLSAMKNLLVLYGCGTYCVSLWVVWECSWTGCWGRYLKLT
jgi:hypothetical protein